MGRPTKIQREILEALTRHWELLRWRCNDGGHRWHMGEDEVDGRAVRGLWQRGLVEIGMRGRLPQLVLTDAGRSTLAALPADRRAGDGGE
jgi:hypothetical protein